MFPRLGVGAWSRLDTKKRTRIRQESDGCGPPLCKPWIQQTIGRRDGTEVCLGQLQDIVQQQYRSSGIVGIDSGNFLWCDKRSSRDNVAGLAREMLQGSRAPGNTIRGSLGLCSPNDNKGRCWIGRQCKCKEITGVGYRGYVDLRSCWLIALKPSLGRVCAGPR